MPLLSADFFYTPEGFVENHLLELDADGTILDFRERKMTKSTLHYTGILSPAFVNAHCHLELSVLKGEVPTNTGMTGFAANVGQKRQGFSEEEKQNALQNALTEAYQTGTLAFGDICNDASTISVKKEMASRFFFHNFIELFGMRVDRAELIVENGKQLAQQFETAGLKNSLTLHAPYSVSLALKSLFYEVLAQNSNELLSFHLLESKAEREIFEQGTGDFAQFYQQIGVDFQGFGEKSPLLYLFEGLASQQVFLAVHNTEMQTEEVAYLSEHYPNALFCLCPRSNLYIHQTFPNILQFLPYQRRICLGTDSLASNWDLNMLEEAKSIQEHYPQITLHTLLTWLTMNGAKALQIADWAGSFEVGKKCGVVQLQCNTPFSLTEGYQVRRLY